MSDHCKRPPSSWPGLLECPLYESGPAGESAKKGTLGHAAYTLILQGKPDEGLELLKDWNEWDRNGIVWAAETTKSAMGEIAAESIDRRVKYFSNPDDFEPLFYGTADAICHRDGNLILYDLKTGKRREYGPQMCGYAACACQEFNVEKVTAWLLYSEERVVEMMTITRHQAEHVMRLVLEPKESQLPRSCEHCQWCAKAATCPEVNKYALAVLEGNKQWKLDSWDPARINSPDQLALALAAKEVLKTWCEQIGEKAKTEVVDNGMIIPGYELKSRQGNREITSLPKAFEASGMKPEEFLKACKVSVGQLEKLMGKKAFTERLDPLIQRAATVTYLQKSK